MKTTYIVQPFDAHTVKGRRILKPATPMQFAGEAEALGRAERMAAKHTGVVAVSQAYDEESGEMGKTTVLAQHGEVPEELFENF